MKIKTWTLQIFTCPLLLQLARRLLGYKGFVRFLLVVVVLEVRFKDGTIRLRNITWNPISAVFKKKKKKLGFFFSFSFFFHHFYLKKGKIKPKVDMEAWVQHSTA